MRTLLFFVGRGLTRTPVNHLSLPSEISCVQYLPGRGGEGGALDRGLFYGSKFWGGGGVYAPKGPVC